MIFPVHALPFGEPPEPFDQIQIGRIGREEHQTSVQLDRQCWYDLVPLITRVVEDNGDRPGETRGGHLAEQFAHGVGVHHGRIGNGDQSSRDGVPSAQNIEALAAGRGSNEHPGDRPQTTQKSAEDEMSSIDEEDVTIAGDRKSVV